jgi:F0F1-type ATP synthase membrane subunit b/b'
MDILHLVDRLEELFNQSRAIPFTHSVLVDEDRMLDIIDQMKGSIPEEIKKAQQLLVQRDRLIAQANEEANRTLTLAREKGDHFLDQDAVVQGAREKADQIIAQAKAEAEVVRQEADDYVLDSLTRLHDELDRTINQVRNGIRTLQTDKSAKS